MKVTAAATVFQVVSVEKALAFYCDVLGFEQDFRFGDYAGIHRGECCLHLCGHSTWKRPCGGGMVTVFCDEVDRFHAEIAGLGAKIELPPTDEPYGMRDCVVRDPDGNLLTFGCSLEKETEAIS